MKRFAFVSSPLASLGIAAVFLVSQVAAAPLEQSTITEVVKEVNVIDAATKKQHRAEATQVFRMPDLMRTASDSRAEMVAPDATVTRVGANSVFSFEQAKREINLQRGSVLFNSPTGKGGGTIKTAAATASVLGTTIIVVATKNGGFKFLVLEGHGRAQLPNGKTLLIGPGQLTFIMPGSQDFGPVVMFRLSEQTAAARLVNGFKRRLPSMDKILAAIALQERLIAVGQLRATNLLLVDTNVIDPNIRQEEADTRPDTLTPFLRAYNRDAVIRAPKLDPERIFTTQTSGVELSRAIENAARGISAFIARNTTFATPSVDFSEFAGDPLFAFITQKDFIFTGDTKMENLHDTPLYFVSVDGRVRATAPTVLDFPSKAGVNFIGGITRENFKIDGGELVKAGISYRTYIQQEDGGGSSPIPPVYGLTLHSPNGPLKVTALNDLSVRFVNFISGDTSLSARTITLRDVDFGGNRPKVTLSSASGRLASDPNSGRPVSFGDVNFIKNVTYQGDAAQNHLSSKEIRIDKR